MTATPRRVYDMRPDPDPKNRLYPARAMLPANAQRKTRVWDCYARLDQRSEGHCVGFALAHELAAEPIAVPFVNNALADAMFFQAQDNDEWPGRDYEGTSLKAGMKVGVQRGYYRGYRWPFGENEVALVVGNVGPVILSIKWTAGMERVDGAGFIHASGPVRGRHCICARGVVAGQSPNGAWRRIWFKLTGDPLGHYVLRNSWGPDWGRNGDCYLTSRDMARLLKAGGEAAIPEGRMMVPGRV
jgi:hypothetical protein